MTIAPVTSFTRQPATATDPVPGMARSRPTPPPMVPPNVIVRALSRDDRPRVAELLCGLSGRSRQMRFAAPMPEIDERVVQYLCAADGDHHVALGVHAGDRLVAMGRCVRYANQPAAADVALTVADDWQGRGLGPSLLRRLAGLARDVGVERFVFIVSGDNRPAQKMLGRLGVRLTYHAGLGEGTLEVAELLGDTVPDGRVVVDRAA